MKTKTVYPSLNFLSLVENEAARDVGNSDFHVGISAFYNHDYPKAYNIFSQLAKDGNRRAWYCLAEMHKNGQGVPKDESKAYAIWSLIAADDRGHGVKHAQNNSRKIAKSMNSKDLKRAHELLKAPHRLIGTVVMESMPAMAQAQGF